MIVLRMIGSLLRWAVVVSVLAAGAYALWIGIPWALHEIASLYREATPEFKLGLITAVLSTAGVVWSVMYQRSKEIESLRFERKREAYGVFFDLLFDFMKASDAEGVQLDDASIKDRFRDLTKRMMIWGSPSTINAFNKYQVESATPDPDIQVTFARTEALLRQFRADLGHRDRRLGKLALTKMMLKGDEHHMLDA